MRTNIVLNEDLLREAAKYTGPISKRAIVEQALRTFVEVQDQKHRLATLEERVHDIDERLGKVVLRVPASVILKADRQRR